MQVVRAQQAPNVSDQQVNSEIQNHCFLKLPNVWCDPPGNKSSGMKIVRFTG